MRHWLLPHAHGRASRRHALLVVPRRQVQRRPRGRPRRNAYQAGCGEQHTPRPSSPGGLLADHTPPPAPTLHSPPPPARPQPLPTARPSMHCPPRHPSPPAVAVARAAERVPRSASARFEQPASDPRPAGAIGPRRLPLARGALQDARGPRRPTVAAGSRGRRSLPRAQARPDRRRRRGRRDALRGRASDARAAPSRRLLLEGCPPRARPTDAQPRLDLALAHRLRHLPTVPRRRHRQPGRAALADRAARGTARRLQRCGGGVARGGKRCSGSATDRSMGRGRPRLGGLGGRGGDGASLGRPPRLGRARRGARASP